MLDEAAIEQTQTAAVPVQPLRPLPMLETLRVPHVASVVEVQIEDRLNYWFIQNPPFDSPRMILSSGINGVAALEGAPDPRVPAIALRSSPWKAGDASTPWHDEFDLDHGHIRYFGDHKATTIGPVGTTRGNKQLLAAWQLHSSGDTAERLAAPPILVFRSVPVYRGTKRIDKGHIQFCGAALIERLEYVVQRDRTTGRSFPNLVVDLNVIQLENEELDFRWIDDRRDRRLTNAECLRHAPNAWRQWVQRGRVALPSIRRRVLSSRVASRAEQLPEAGSRQEAILEQVYRAFDDNKHAFEWLAARVAEVVLTESGASYTAGWLTRPGGDGGMDFVGRLNVGSTQARTPLVVLGQAKCITPGTGTISPDQVARVVARLRRGWIGVFVTTGTFSKQAQVEIVDDEYPVVLVPGRVLADAVFRLAEQSYAGDVARLLADVLNDYAKNITHRRPAEILSQP